MDETNGKTVRETGPEKRPGNGKMRKLPEQLYLAGALIVFLCTFLTAQVGVDYPKHAKLAMRMIWSDPVSFLRRYSEPLWHLLVRAAASLPGIGVEAAGGIVSGICMVCAWVIAYRTFRKEFPAAGAGETAVLCTVLHLSSAIYLPFFNIQPYLGQSSPNIWHNPTLIMLRPLMLLFFVKLGAVINPAGQRLRGERTGSSPQPRGEQTGGSPRLRGEQAGGSPRLRGEQTGGNPQPRSRIAGVPVPELTLRGGIVMSLLLLLTNLAKPSFVQVFFPGIFLLMVIWLIRFRGRNFFLSLKLLAVCLPSFGMLCFQLFKNFGSGESNGAGIVIMPFYVAGLRTPCIPVSFMLLMAFPIVMLIITLRRRRLRADEQLGGTMLFAGMLMWYLLAESGRRLKHGNFGWGYDSAVCLVWFLAMRAYLELSEAEKERTPGGKSRAYIIASAVLLLHFLSGLAYLGILIVLRHGM